MAQPEGDRGDRTAGIATAILVVAAFAARLPAVAQPLGIDQGIFATAGWGLTRGLMLYRDLWDQKPPGIHLTYAAAIAIAGPRPSVAFWLDLAAALAVAASLYALARALAGRRVARAAILFYAILTLPAARYPYGGFLERAVPECFISLFVAAAALLIARHRATAGALLAAGVCVGIAAVFKPTAIVYWPLFLLWVFAYGVLERRRALIGTLGLFVAPAATGIWLWRAGVAPDAWIAVVEYNRAYVAAGSGPLVLVSRVAHESWRLVKTDPLWTAGTIAIMGAAVRSIRTRRVTPAAALGTLWLAGAVLAAAANGVRLYSNYFIPASTPLALLGGCGLHEIMPPGRMRRLLAAAITFLLVAVAVHSHYLERLWSSERADVHALASAGTQRDYLLAFGGYRTGRGYSARANAELADYVESHTGPDDRIYIFGMAPSVYLISQRLPANRFIWTYPGVANLVHRSEFTVDALARDLGSARPLYVIFEANNRDSLSGWRIENDFRSPAMQQLLAGYTPDTVIEDFTAYRRRSPAGP